MSPLDSLYFVVSNSSNQLLEIAHHRIWHYQWFVIKVEANHDENLTLQFKPLLSLFSRVIFPFLIDFKQKHSQERHTNYARTLLTEDREFSGCLRQMYSQVDKSIWFGCIVNYVRSSLGGLCLRKGKHKAFNEDS